MSNKNLKMLTVTKASESYGIEKSLIYYWIRNNKFSFFGEEENSKILFFEKDFLQFIESNINEPVDIEGSLNQTDWI